MKPEVLERTHPLLFPRPMVTRLMSCAVCTPTMTSPFHARSTVDNDTKYANAPKGRFYDLWQEGCPMSKLNKNLSFPWPLGHFSGSKTTSESNWYWDLYIYPYSQIDKLGNIFTVLFSLAPFQAVRIRSTEILNVIQILCFLLQLRGRRTIKEVSTWILALGMIKRKNIYF